jgi:hypothetical protein
MSLHDIPKLGVAATVEHLEIAPDPDGAVYFHNVRVNGILPSEEGPGIWQLLGLLNSRVLDFCFRRGAAEHANGHYAANKQFIAPLPVRIPDSGDAERLEALARDLWGLNRGRNDEIWGFRRWLGGAVGVPLRGLAGHTNLNAYYEMTGDEVLALLGRNRRRMEVNPGSRAFSEQLTREFDASVERLRPLDIEITQKESELETAVFDLYGMSSSQRESIDAEYDC